MRPSPGVIGKKILTLSRQVAFLQLEFHRVGVTVLLATYDEALFLPHGARRLALDHGRITS